MNIELFEAIVEAGQIRLMDGVQLPDRLKVFVIVPDNASIEIAHIYTPRLTNSSKAEDFVMEVVED